MNLYGQLNRGCDLGLGPKLVELEKGLREVGRRRNQYAHGHWSDTAEGSFLPVKVTAKRDGVYHVYRKFSVKEMQRDLRLIQRAQRSLDGLDELINQLVFRQTSVRDSRAKKRARA